MPPGPSQAGKFKPRKPAKKIRPGAAVAAAVVPDAAPSSAAAPPVGAPAAAAGAPLAATGGRGRGSSSSSRGGGERGGRGGGRGRGRRAPVIQGRGFFVGMAASSSVDPKTARANARGKKGETEDGIKGGLIGKRKDESTEEVVGIMDKAIGSNFGEGGGKRSVLDDYNDGDYTGQSRFDNEGSGGGGYFNEDGIFYDTDSSVEEAKPRRKNHNIQPVTLPFPVAPLPVGIGTKDNQRAPMYDNPGEETTVTTTTAISEVGKPSPFVDTANKTALQQELNSFFLFQFPTRLPPLVQQSTASQRKDPANTEDDDQEMEEADSEAVKVEDSGPTLTTTAEVVTPPANPGSFDNSMTGAVPGRLGKLVVYKSGKTVLILQGPDGSPEIRMNVTEGLTCGFDQHAVIIDPDEGRYVKLGSVHKTAVVTPDLDKAFAAY